HRTYPGHIRGLIAWRRRHFRKDRLASAIATVEEEPSTMPSRGGWKHRVSAALQRMGEYVWFPDLRGEWLSHVQPRLDELLALHTPDMVLCSPEPASTLHHGLRAKQARFRWVAVMAVSVLAPYTLSRWQSTARQLGSDVCDN